MEREPLLNHRVEDSPQEVQASHIRNLLFGNLILFIITLAAFIHSPVQGQYLYMRVSEEVFDNTRTKSHSHNGTCYLNRSDSDYILEEEAQKLAAAKNMQFVILKSTLAVFTTVILGAYSDSIGRKFLFAIPLIGHCFKYGIVAVIIYWNLDINFLFLSEGIDGLTGGYCSILLAGYAYASDNTPPTGSRTIAIALVEFCQCVAVAMSSMATGYFIQDVGFFYPMLTATLLCLLDIILVLLLLPERPNIRRRERGCCISPLVAIKRVFGFYFLDDSRRRKIRFILAMLVFCFILLPSLGGTYIDTLYKLNHPFCWSPKMIGYYATASLAVQQIFGVPLTRLLQCCTIDEIIGLIGSLSLAGAAVLQGFASTNLMLYAVILVKIPAATSFSICRSILSKMAPVNRQGSLFASIAFVETLCAMTGTPIFSNIYQKTVVYWRGFVFISMALFYLLATVFLIVFIVVSKPERQRRMSALQGNTDMDEEEHVNTDRREAN